MSICMHRVRRCPSAGRVTTGLLLSFLLLSPPVASERGDGDSSHRQQQPLIPPLSIPKIPQAGLDEHVFTLRHVFHHANLDRPHESVRLDIPETDSSVWLGSEDGPPEEVTRPLVVKSSPMSINRLKDRRPSVIDPMVAGAREYGSYWGTSAEDWIFEDVSAPNITDKETVITFAQMAANAYVDVPDTGDWKDVNGGFNRTDDHGFGWDGTGLRGYLYSDETNSTIVIGLKGTSFAIFWGGDGTTTNDKENDNLFFSCCCGQQGSVLYRQVCDCAVGTYTCNLTCLKRALKKENRYYAAARHLYNNVTALYPNSQVWMSGHSLGGAVSAMIGLTYGVPVLTFEAVPDALPANRLGLPVPPGVDPDRPGQRDFTGAYHFGHTADPIFMGTCNGATASCSYAGYALESACHSGRECTYDVVKDNGTRVSIVTHKIIWTIAYVIKQYDSVPECKFTPECYDCPLWKEVTGNSSLTTSLTSSSTRTNTRTSTCKTPGWWGCLDETTTISGTATSTSETTTTTSTVTCKTPGWFGCNDETTTTSSSKTFIPTVTSSPSTPTRSKASTTCETPGWFGCNDKPRTTKPPDSSSSTCTDRGIFWGCYDHTTATRSHSHPITSPPLMPSSTGTRSTDSSTSSHDCTSQAWFGLICLDPSPTVTHKPKPTKLPHVKHCMNRNWLGFCREWAHTIDALREEI